MTFFEPNKRDQNLLPQDVFKALIVPRPIGWISTRSLEGEINLAPYSWFNGVYSWPNILAFAGEDRKKDSIALASQTGVFAWNMATWDLRKHMNLSSAGLERGKSEFELAELTPVDGKLIGAPIVKESPVSLECEVTQIVDLKDLDGNTVAGSVVFGQVVGIHIHDKFIVNGKIDSLSLKPIARCGYNEYTVINNIFTMERPP